MITENLLNLEEQIVQTCKRSGRAREEITLIAVSKTKPIEMLKEAYQTGIRNFGENKVQELCEKYEQLPKDIHWHLIGHLQRNKVKYIVDKAACIHSLDSIRLAEEIQKEAVKKNVIVPVLIQVNIAQEESKYGFHPEETIQMVETISKMDHLKIEGLMTIGPFVEDPEENRKIFSQLKKLSVDITLKNIDNVTMNVLSMGMSGDYLVAIEEGATMVRVGTGIFGARNYNKEI